MNTDGLLLLRTTDDVAWTTSELIVNRLRARPESRLALPTGATPLPTYALLKEHVRADNLSFAAASFFMLDEYCGLSHRVRYIRTGTSNQTYQEYLREHLDVHNFKHFHQLDGDAPDLALECRNYQSLLDEAPLDLVVLGLGSDGHVAFNEPGSEPTDGVREVKLAKQTREAAAKYFGGLRHVPKSALTIGIADLLKARELVIIATGAHKHEALNNLLSGPMLSLGGERRNPYEDTVLPSCPAAYLRVHPRLTVLCDQAAREGK